MLVRLERGALSDQVLVLISSLRVATSSPCNGYRRLRTCTCGMPRKR